MKRYRIAGVIPARLNSTRLSRKVLRGIAGRPMVEWVWRAAKVSGLMDPVVVATDSDEVACVCRDHGIPVVMTSTECPSGTDRVREVAYQIDADIYVNIQGDEPTLTADFFPPLLDLFARPEVEAATLAVHCPTEEVANPNAVKVVTTLDGRALYFSRATIPFDRDWTGFTGYRKHLGIYAYRKAALERFAKLPTSPLERIERLEQLRLLENGIGLYVAEAPDDTIGVDTEADLQRAEVALKRIEARLALGGTALRFSSLAQESRNAAVAVNKLEAALRQAREAPLAPPPQKEEAPKQTKRAQAENPPARFAAGGRGEKIGYATIRSPFGWLTAGVTERGLCWMAPAETKAKAEAGLREEFSQATLKRDPSLTALAEAALLAVSGKKGAGAKKAIPLDLRGTEFQLRVWQALRAIPRGQTRSYSQLAGELGEAEATRAVARACASNRVALLVPCHRVVGADGSLAGYRWGVERKRQLLEAEGVKLS